jgi:hypothetical protein
MPWYKQSGAFQRPAAVNRQPRKPFARGDGDLPLLKPMRCAILASKRPGIWRMSANLSTRNMLYHVSLLARTALAGSFPSSLTLDRGFDLWKDANGSCNCPAFLASSQ